jgi:hypothetical protein
MFLRKDKVLLSMKCIAALFLAFMFTNSVKFMINMQYENLEVPGVEDSFDLKGKNEEELCTTYWLFLIYAFVLGAFWNVKKIRKVGIV